MVENAMSRRRKKLAAFGAAVMLATSCDSQSSIPNTGEPIAGIPGSPISSEVSYSYSLRYQGALDCESDVKKDALVKSDTSNETVIVTFTPDEPELNGYNGGVMALFYSGLQLRDPLQVVYPQKKGSTFFTDYKVVIERPKRDVCVGVGIYYGDKSFPRTFIGNTTAERGTDPYLQKIQLPEAIYSLPAR